MHAQHGMDAMRERHRTTLWAPFAVIALGGFLAVSPLAFAYGDAGLVVSDVVCGILLVGLGYRSLSPRGGLARWGATAVGIWLLFAPLAFWAPTAASYAVDTLVGTLVIAFSILVPGMPGMRMLPGPTTPPGWSYNPSSWPQRLPPIAAALAAFLIARYMAGFQLEHVDAVWDPFFGSGTERILDSEISRAWPISDAGLGSAIYAGEALMGYMGSPMRWRTMPWMVAFFGVAVIPLGVVSIALVIMQPVAVGTWCTLCLATALAMLVMIPLAVDEVVAMIQFLVRRTRGGLGFWHAFILGYGIDGDEDDRSPAYGAPPSEAAPAAVWGVTVPWGLLVAALAGVWLLAAPDLLGTPEPLGTSNHITGAVAATVAVVVMAEPVRIGRFLNAPVGLWIAASPVLLGGQIVDIVNGLVVGALVAGLSLPRGPIRERYGTWSRWVRYAGPDWHVRCGT